MAYRKLFRILALGMIVTIPGITNSSCIREYETLTQYTIRNESEQNVKIIIPDFYSGGGIPMTDTIFQLDPHSEVGYYYLQDGLNAATIPPFGYGADSAWIVFNDLHTVFYYRFDSVPRNILNIYSYQGGKQSESRYEYLYVVSEEDFQNAQK